MGRFLRAQRCIDHFTRFADARTRETRRCPPSSCSPLLSLSFARHCCCCSPRVVTILASPRKDYSESSLPFRLQRVVSLYTDIVVAKFEIQSARSNAGYLHFELQEVDRRRTYSRGYSRVLSKACARQQWRRLKCHHRRTKLSFPPDVIIVHYDTCGALPTRLVTSAARFKQSSA